MVSEITHYWSTSQCSWCIVKKGNSELEPADSKRSVRMSVTTFSLRHMSNCKRVLSRWPPLWRFALSALWKSLEWGLHCVCMYSRAGVVHIQSKPPLTPHQLSAGNGGSYIRRLLGDWSGSITLIFSHSVCPALGNSPIWLLTFVKWGALHGIGTPAVCDPI